MYLLCYVVWRAFVVVCWVVWRQTTAFSTSCLLWWQVAHMDERISVEYESPQTIKLSFNAPCTRPTTMILALVGFTISSTLIKVNFKLSTRLLNFSSLVLFCAVVLSEQRHIYFEKCHLVFYSRWGLHSAKSYYISSLCKHMFLIKTHSVGSPSKHLISVNIFYWISRPNQLPHDTLAEIWRFYWCV